MGWAARLPAGLGRVAPGLIHAGARLTRPLTMGVRAAILREGAAGAEVFLVRHSYIPGWHLPGGAVEVGETAAEALCREVREECALEVEGAPALFGLYFNRRASRRDHVALFRVPRFRVLGPRAPDWEILDARFFPAAALPEGTAGSVRARLAELAGAGAPAADW